ncbi:hypothetical protein DENSPDRAFT_485075 [Dentipellis sp. KUC8613]|nr:hypothetical protein DENSPDRAFT_485075 [Dentipellis sp. KUC8613]
MVMMAARRRDQVRWKRGKRAGDSERTMSSSNAAAIARPCALLTRPRSPLLLLLLLRVSPSCLKTHAPSPALAGHIVPSSSSQTQAPIPTAATTMPTRPPPAPLIHTIPTTTPPPQIASLPLPLTASLARFPPPTRLTIPLPSPIPLSPLHLAPAHHPQAPQAIPSLPSTSTATDSPITTPLSPATPPTLFSSNIPTRTCPTSRLHVRTTSLVK